MKRILSTIATAGILGIGLGFAPQANASTLGNPPTLFSGNDCAGVFGQPFEECKDPMTQSPIIAKFEVVEVMNQPDQIETTPEINSIFDTITGNEFSFVLQRNDAGEIISGTWFYIRNDVHDPLITSYVAKAGDFFYRFGSDNIHFDNQTNTYSGQFFTPLVNPNDPNSAPAGLSHITFYDTKVKEVSEPSLLLGIGAVIGGGILLRRRKSS